MVKKSSMEMLQNIDARLSRIEQYLPTLSTREGVDHAIAAAVAPLPTREDVDKAIAAAVAPLATREDMDKGIAAAIAPLATREELQAAIAPLATREELRAAVAPLATREELQAEGERARRHATMLFEDIRDDHRIILDHLIALSARVDALARGA